MKKKASFFIFMWVLSSLFLFTGCDPDDGDKTDQVVMIGDSIFALSGEIANELERLSGEAYRSYYVSGAEMESGFVTPIPNQYKKARNQDSNIRTIIMDGGGNDIQIGAAFSCTGGDVTQTCMDALQAALDAADQLFSDMRADGVQNIIYMNYFYIIDENKKPAFDWMHDQMETIALNYNAIIVDPMPYMKPSLIAFDNIHPTDEGSQMLANLIWDAMVENNIEQP
jgi:hypothetical protein